MLPAACLLPLLSGRAMGAAAGSCVEPGSASESLLKSLSYIDAAADAAKSCKVCAFFTQDDAAPACGKCTLANGPVSASGHCEGWAAKEEPAGK